jgi:hypothetical protein
VAGQPSGNQNLMFPSAMVAKPLQEERPTKATVKEASTEAPRASLHTLGEITSERQPTTTTAAGATCLAPCLTVRHTTYASPQESGRPPKLHAPQKRVECNRGKYKATRAPSGRPPGIDNTMH